MTSILIVDDEALIRRGLESLIPWERLNCSLADQASNGDWKKSADTTRILYLLILKCRKWTDCR